MTPSMAQLLERYPEMQTNQSLCVQGGRIEPHAEATPEQNVVVCMPLEHGGHIGATQRRCADCNAIVWEGSSARAFLEGRRLLSTILCPGCVARRIEQQMEGEA